jgi:hypothetical protein
MESNWLNRIETGRTADIETAVCSTTVVTEVTQRPDNHELQALLNELKIGVTREITSSPDG